MKRRLNPLALPAETDARFLLFACAVFGLALVALEFGLWGLMPDKAGALPQAPPAGSAAGDYRAYFAESGASLMGSFLVLPWLFTLVFLASWWWARRHPARIGRRLRLEPMAKCGDRLFAEQVGKVLDEAGVTPVPSVWMIPDMKAVRGFAYGLQASPRLALSGAFRLLLRQHPERFRAVVLHETGHWRNRDVGKAMLADALLRVALVALWLPLAGLVLWWAASSVLARGAAAISPEFLWDKVSSVAVTLMPMALGFVLLRLTWASLLRVREFYADAASASLGGGAGLVAFFEASLRAAPAPDPWPWRDRVRRWWALHPSTEDRRLALAEPGRLFRLGPELSFLSGALVGSSLVGLVLAAFKTGIVIDGLMMAGGASMVKSIFGMVILCGSAALVAVAPGVVLAGSVGAQVRRAALASLAGVLKFDALRIWLNAAGLVAGLQVGLWSVPVIAPPGGGWLLAGVPFVVFVLWLNHRVATRLLATTRKPSRSRAFALAGWQSLTWSFTVAVLAAPLFLPMALHQHGWALFQTMLMVWGVGVSILAVSAMAVVAAGRVFGRDCAAPDAPDFLAWAWAVEAPQSFQHGSRSQGEI